MRSSCAMRERFGRLARGDAGDFQRLVAVDLEFAGALLGGDAFGGEGPLARDAGRLRPPVCGDLGFLDRAGLPDLERAGALVGRRCVRR